MLSARETAPPSLSAALEIFILWVDRGIVKAEWRSVWRGSGGLCVTVGGTKERHWWCAGKVDLEQEVITLSFLRILCYVYICLLFELQEPHL